MSGSEALNESIRSAEPSDRRLFELPRLAWGTGALAPVISERTVQFHHGRHHAGYVDTANRLLRDRPEVAQSTPEQVVETTRGSTAEEPLYRAASQAVNHALLWRSLTPGRQRPGAELGRAIEQTFGDYARFANDFASAGAAHFGSGWLWLAASRDGRLTILCTRDADAPDGRKLRPLLTVDLWEHAYYLDHQDRRREYLDAVIDRRLNWGLATESFASASNPHGARCPSTYAI